MMIFTNDRSLLARPIKSIQYFAGIFFSYAQIQWMNRISNVFFSPWFWIDYDEVNENQFVLIEHVQWNDEFLETLFCIPRLFSREKKYIANDEEEWTFYRSQLNASQEIILVKTIEIIFKTFVSQKNNDAGLSMSMKNLVHCLWYDESIYIGIVNQRFRANTKCNTQIKRPHREFDGWSRRIRPISVGNKRFFF